MGHLGDLGQSKSINTIISASKIFQNFYFTNAKLEYRYKILILLLRQPPSPPPCDILQTPTMRLALKFAKCAKMCP